MRKLWIVKAKDTYGDVVWMKMTKRKKKAEKYLEECQEFFEEYGINCEMKLGEFYTLDEAERLNL
ncbi:C64 [Sulfolobus spindle-shaped virus Lassen]|nr:C64 [Sulfolobus spindle-shaped virus Lassen]